MNSKHFVDISLSLYKARGNGKPWKVSNEKLEEASLIAAGHMEVSVLPKCVVYLACIDNPCSFSQKLG